MNLENNNYFKGLKKDIVESWKASEGKRQIVAANIHSAWQDTQEFYHDADARAHKAWEDSEPVRRVLNQQYKKAEKIFVVETEEGKKLRTVFSKPAGFIGRRIVVPAVVTTVIAVSGAMALTAGIFTANEVRRSSTANPAREFGRAYFVNIKEMAAGAARGTWELMPYHETIENIGNLFEAEPEPLPRGKYRLPVPRTSPGSRPPRAIPPVSPRSNPPEETPSEKQETPGLKL